MSLYFILHVESEKTIGIIGILYIIQRVNQNMKLLQNKVKETRKNYSVCAPSSKQFQGQFAMSFDERLDNRRNKIFEGNSVLRILWAQ